MGTSVLMLTTFTAKTLNSSYRDFQIKQFFHTIFNWKRRCAGSIACIFDCIIFGRGVVLWLISIRSWLCHPLIHDEWRCWGCDLRKTIFVFGQIIIILGRIREPFIINILLTLVTWHMAKITVVITTDCRDWFPFSVVPKWYYWSF